MARNELLNELCDAGVDEDIEVVESEMVCDVVVEDIRPTRPLGGTKSAHRLE
jgi:hypothetical protein